MKKGVCVLVLVCVIMGSAFAQEKEKKNSLALDVFQLFRGFVAIAPDDDFGVFIFSAAYERLLAPHFSLGGDLDMYFMGLGSTPGFYFGLAAEGRYYPMSANFEKFFLGATLGFNVLAIDGETDKKHGGFAGLTVSLKAGYKLITSKNFYFEPSMGYVLSKSSSIGLTPSGWNGGLRLGFVF